MEMHQGLIDLFVVVASYIMISFIVVWVIGLAIKDSSIVDIWFAPCIGIAAVMGYYLAEGAEPRRELVMILAVLWAVRLGAGAVWHRVRRHRRSAIDALSFKSRQPRSGARHGAVAILAPSELLR